MVSTELSRKLHKLLEPKRNSTDIYIYYITYSNDVMLTVWEQSRARRSVRNSCVLRHNANNDTYLSVQENPELIMDQNKRNKKALQARTD